MPHLASTPPSQTTSKLDPKEEHAKKVVKHLQEGSRLKKTDPKDALRIYTDMARWIPLAIDPFIVFGNVIYAALEQSNESNEELLAQYQAILKLEPRLENVLQCLNEDPAQLDNFIKEIEDAMNGARTDNTSSLKPAILKYVLKDPDANLHPKVPETGSKACRAFRHPVFARHLCPIKKLSNFDRNPE
ncbi:hypothetical protein C0992_007746 [Termitomyces sp. T32_za158]|nr:hypothetical protein C0992_007746 [Termitomyces sp. T32_za158]